MVTNVTPIAADVSGFVTKIYVSNGTVVKKDEPLFEVYQKPYQLEYDHASAKYKEAVEHLKVIEQETEKTTALLKAAKFSYEKAQYEFDLKNASSVHEALSKLEVKKRNYDMQTAKNNRHYFLAKQLAVEDQEMVKQEQTIKAAKALMHNAKVNLDLTVVRAPSDGVVDNLYIGLGTPVKIHEPLFSFIDTSTWWIQANLNETDLRNVRPGDEVIIMLRMYYFDRIFHGKVVNTMWAADRKTTIHRTQQQRLISENDWLLVRIALSHSNRNP